MSAELIEKSLTESTTGLIVRKYGGATLSDPNKIKHIAKKILNLHQSGSKIVVVVSAMGETTNQLIALAHQVAAKPRLRELDMLLTVGERISMALLSLALNELGCSAISYTGSQAGILTDDSHINANIVEVKAFRVEEALKENKVVILAGFQGVSRSAKEITTLGRGGSDISAVAMASYLKADCCEILKDVDCIYSADPKLVKSAKPITQLNYHHLLEMTFWGAKVLHHRSVSLAAEKKVDLYIGSATESNNSGTKITDKINFTKQFILAINTFSHVYELSFKNEFNERQPELPADLQKEFYSYLQKNQIGQLQFLFSKLNKYYYTAPQEILNSLLQFSTQQDYFKITNSELTSVSATYALSPEEKDLTELKNMLIKNKIQITDCCRTTHNLNFIVHSKDKNQVVQILHDLI